MPMGVHWTWSRFADLGVDNLYDALALRCRVFVLEQGPYLDPDGIDRHAWHLLGRNADGVLQAYLRVVGDPGLRATLSAGADVLAARFDARAVTARWEALYAGAVR